MTASPQLIQEQQSFANTIYSIVQEKELSHFEAILWYVKKEDLEIESISQLIGGSLKDKIQIEAENLHMVQRKK